MKKTFLLLAVISMAALSACTGNEPTPTPPTQPTESAAPVATESAATTPTEKSYTLTDVALHKTAEDCWTVIDGMVYDLSKFIALGIHNPKIVDGCGIDATGLFVEVSKHSEPSAQENLAKYLIGSLSQ